ncbi:MAG: hypothetical protein GF349_01295 [Candidatus Magasanikbacteria bacterium]|nr:hypothetical protein [Candidatus Magasanikbacteria bacterium]
MEEKKFEKTWLNLYLISSILFTIIGLVMLIIDNKYLAGSQYLITAIIFITAIFLIKKNKISPNYSNPMLFLGFIFSIIGLTSPIGLSMHIGLWSLGIIFFLSGLFAKEKKHN